MASFDVLVPTTAPPVIPAEPLSPGAIFGIIIAAVVAAVVLMVVILIIIYVW